MTVSAITNARGQEVRAQALAYLLVEFNWKGVNCEMEKNIIAEYTLDEAIADGVLHPLGWVNGKPLIGTAGTVADLPDEERQRLFADFLMWQKEIEPTLPEEDRMFSATASNGERVWVIDDGAAITLLYPEEY